MASMIGQAIFLAVLICCVSCYTLSMDEGTEETVAESSHDRCSQTFPERPKIFPHESNCSFFYVCQYGEAVLKSCPSNLHFNPNNYVCDYPERAGCKREGSKETREQTVDQNVVVSCPAENPGHPVLRPHPHDCEMFFICDGGKAYPKSCQKGLHFNAKLQVCDYPPNAQCEKRTTKSPRVNVVNENGCPAGNSKIPVLLPHPTDCGKFYICDDGIAIPKSCQSGLHFNPKVQSCDYPENAQCDTSYTKTPKIKVINENDCPAENSETPVLLPHPTDCGKFYICDAGIAIPKSCQPGLHFNPKVQTCDHPENAQCDDSDTKSLKIKVINENGCPAENSQTPVLLPHPTDCGKFYICDSGIAIPKSCQSGLHFNPKVQSCDYPENAQCDTRITKSPRGKIVNENGCPAEDSGIPVLLPHPIDCEKFFICDGGIAHQKTCQSGLHFNRKLQACDYPQNSQCDTSVSKSPRGKNVYENVCPEESSGRPILIADPTDCKKFFICDDGVSYPMSCHSDLHFNVKLQACDYPGNAGCLTGASKEPILKEKIEHPLVRCPSSKQILLPHPYDCQKFFMCDGGVAHPRTCPAKLHFNQELQACDYPDTEYCAQQRSSYLKGYPSLFCPMVNGKVPIYFPHSTNCSIYYMCSHGYAYEFVCPAKLHFNLRKKICDYEASARCRPALSMEGS